jgi:hypothetical protein
VSGAQTQFIGTAQSSQVLPAGDRPGPAMPAWVTSGGTAEAH